MFKSAVPTAESPSTQEPEQKVRAKGTEQFKSVFDTSNLTGESESQNQEAPRAKGTEGYKGVFDPTNLKDGSGTSQGD